MSVDLIGWETLKTIDFQKNLIKNLASQESAESGVQEIKIRLELLENSFGKEVIFKSLDTIMDFIKLQRIQIIWINACAREENHKISWINFMYSALFGGIMGLFAA